MWFWTYIFFQTCVLVAYYRNCELILMCGLLIEHTERVRRILRRTGFSLMFTFVNAIMVHTCEMHGFL